MSTVTNSLNKVFFRQSATPEHTIASQEAGVVYYGTVVDGGLLIDDSGDGSLLPGPFATLVPYMDGDRVAFVLRSRRPLILSVEGGFGASDEYAGLASIGEVNAEAASDAAVLAQQAKDRAEAASDAFEEFVPTVDAGLGSSLQAAHEAATDALQAKDDALAAHTEAMQGISDAAAALAKANKAEGDAAAAASTADTAKTNAAAAQSAADQAKADATSKSAEAEAAAKTYAQAQAASAEAAAKAAASTDATAKANAAQAAAVAAAALDAKTKADAAQAAAEAKAATAQTRAEQAFNNAGAAQERADLAKSLADAAQVLAVKAEGDAASADGKAVAAQSAATAAQSSATAAQSKADSAFTNAATAQNTASSAATAASNAQSKADTAASDLLALAGKTGRVVPSTTAPTGDDRNVNNLWLNTSNGQLSQWTGSAWSVVTDSRLTAAANAATAAQTTADQAKTNAATAQTKADQAFTDAADAKTAANNAAAAALGAQSTADTANAKASTADGRMTVATANPVAADAVGKPLDAVWEVRSGSTVLRKFVLTAASTWTQVKVGQDFVGDKAIGRAQVADVAIGTAQVADAAITNAKVGDMSVDKLRVTGGAQIPTAVIETLIGQDAYYESMLTSQLVVANQWWQVTGSTGKATVSDTVTVLEPTIRVDESGRAWVNDSGPTVGANRGISMRLGRAYATSESELGSVLIGPRGVTAPMLESELVLASLIIAGDRAGYHVELDQTGVHFFSKLAGVASPVEMLRINTPGTDSDGDVFTLLNPNDLSEATMSVNEAGQTSTSDLTVANVAQFEDVIVKGETLPEAVPRYAAHVVASKTFGNSDWGVNWGGARFIAGTGWKRALEIVWENTTATPRTLWIPAAPITLRTAAAMIIGSAWGWTLDGTTPAANSESLHAWQTTSTLGYHTIATKQVLVEVPAGATFKARLDIYNGGAEWVFEGNQTITVWDLGPVGDYSEGDVVPGSLTVTSGGDASGGAASKKQYTKTWATAWLRTFPTNSFYAGKATQGTWNGTTFRGFLGFPNMVADIGSADIVKIEVYVYMSHWYYNAGGTLSIQGHGQFLEPTAQPGVSGTVVSLKTAKPGGGWVTLPSTYHAGFKAGTLRGIALVGSGLAAYGYATSGQIRVTYKK